MITWCSSCSNATRRHSRLQVYTDGSIVAETICNNCDFIHARKLVKEAPTPEEPTAPPPKPTIRKKPKHDNHRRKSTG